MMVNTLFFLLLVSCNAPSEDHYIPAPKPKTMPAGIIQAEKAKTSKEADSDTLSSVRIDTRNTKADELVSFAETLRGIRYKYGASDPSTGFDCSGFITYVFKHFGISVPRSSIEFTHIAKEISLKEAKRGDIILFTGTDSTRRVVGHMGIITSDEGQSHEFIHSTSGKAYSVTKTPLNRYYQGRFVKVIRIFRNLRHEE